VPTTTPTPRAGELDNDVLDAVLLHVESVRSGAKGDRRFGFDRPWRQFARLMLLLNPQSYGSRMQRYFAEWYGWAGIDPKDDAGDVWDGTERVEVKVSFITGTNDRANFVQIRPWQQIDGYRCFVIDEAFRVWRFNLDKSQMANEIHQMGGIAHGTAGAVAANAHREYAIRLLWDDNNEHTARWLAKYLDWGSSPDRDTRPVG
jgi:hypothetical protein